jgi:hypothetical protein
VYIFELACSRIPLNIIAVIKKKKEDHGNDFIE